MKLGAYAILMALRCEYIVGPQLTKKGRGWLSVKQWTWVEQNIYSRVIPKWKDTMLSVLTHVEKEQKKRELHPTKPSNQ